MRAQRAQPLFERFGLAGFESSRPAELSGGMRQRVAFLRTLLAGKPVLLLDEPFASLDAISRAEMQEWLAGALAEQPATVVLVTHDVEEALYLCDRVAVLTARPARVLETVDLAGGRARSPRLEAVTSPAFTRRARAGARGARRGGRDEALAAARSRSSSPCSALWELAARWDLIADALDIKPFLIPAPSDVAQSLWEDRALLADDAWVTVQEVLLGFAIALVLGFCFAVALHLSDTLRRAFYPLLVASQTVPVIAIAPILVVWLGFGIGPKLAIIALVCFFPITVNTLDGLRSVDPELPRMMRTLDASRCADAAPGRGPVGASVPAQRRQDRRRRLGDRRRLRRVVGRRRGPRPPDPGRPGPAADGAGVRRRGRALGARDRPLRRPRAGRAAARLVEPAP